MLKIFISQPTSNISYEAILRNREEAIKHIHEIFENTPLAIVSNVSDAAPENIKNKDLWYLGASMKNMADSSFAYFCKGWQLDINCQIEHECAVTYGVRIIE